MSTETTKKKVKIDNGTNFAQVYTDKEIDNKLSNISGGGGAPTLSLVDMATQKVRTTITESEKNNLTNGVYNQVIYTSTFDNPFDVYSPCKIIVSNGLSGAFAQFDCSPNADKTSGTIQSFTIYDYTIGTKNASGEYPINIVKHQSLNVGGAKTLILVTGEGTPRTTLTPQEVAKLKNGYYEYAYYMSNLDFSSQIIGIYMRQTFTKDVPMFSSFEGTFNEDTGEAKITGVGFYAIQVDDTADSSGNYPFIIEKNMTAQMSSGSSSTPTLATAFSTTDFASITLTDEDVATIKKQKNNFIIIKTTGNISTENNLCSVTKTGDNEYELTTISGGLVSLLNFADITGGYRFVIDASTKKITNSSLFGSLSITSTSLYLNNNELFLTSSINSPTSNKVNKSYYFDTINGKPILHEDNTINNYEIKTYYNHFIYLALETAANGTATIRINFTNTSSDLINTLDKLKTALGETFTLGGNGSIVNGSTYGTTYMVNQNSITGVVNGAQQVFNFTDGTLTITDSVKQS